MVERGDREAAACVGMETSAAMRREICSGFGGGRVGARIGQIEFRPQKPGSKRLEWKRNQSEIKIGAWPLLNQSLI